jgi:hypothetical protein
VARTSRSRTGRLSVGATAVYHTPVLSQYWATVISSDVAYAVLYKSIVILSLSARVTKCLQCSTFSFLEKAEPPGDCVEGLDPAVLRRVTDRL